MPRAGLTPDRLVAEAADLVDEVGYAGLTLAAVAQPFGVAVPSLYKHLAGLDDLKRRVTVRCVAEFGEALEAAVEGGGHASRLRRVAEAYRHYARHHPGRYEATLPAPAADDDEHRRATEVVLATVLGVLADYGLEGDDAIDAARTVRSALHGFVALEHAGGFGLPRDLDQSYDRLVAALDSALDAWSERA